MSLRNKIIRLAHENPNLRKDLLPLLTKKASIHTPEELANADTIHIKGYGFFTVVGVNRKEQDIYLRSGRKEYTLSVVFGASLAGNGAELKARGNTRMRTRFIQGKDIVIPTLPSNYRDIL